MYENDDNGYDIGKALKGLPGVEYPRDLRTATRAEYVTMVRKSRKPGCPLMIVSFVGFGYGAYYIYTHVLLSFVESIVWVINHSV